MKKFLACFTFVCLSHSASAADDIFSESYSLKLEEYLHNYGVSYCLSKAKAFSPEAEVAMGGYFQLGHYSMTAQNQVESYINQKLNERLGGYKVYPEPAYLMRCLEVTYNDEYKKLIRQQIKNDVLLVPVMPVEVSDDQQAASIQSKAEATTSAVLLEQKPEPETKAKKSKKERKGKTVEPDSVQSTAEHAGTHSDLVEAVPKVTQGQPALPAGNDITIQTAVPAKTMTDKKAEVKAETQTESKTEVKQQTEQAKVVDAVPLSEGDQAVKRQKKEPKKKAESGQKTVQEASSTTQQDLKPTTALAEGKTLADSAVAELKGEQAQAVGQPEVNEKNIKQKEQELKKSDRKKADKGQAEPHDVVSKEQAVSPVESKVVDLQSLHEQKTLVETQQERAQAVVDATSEQVVKQEEVQTKAKQKKQKKAKGEETSSQAFIPPEVENKQAANSEMEAAQPAVEAQAKAEHKEQKSEKDEQTEAGSTKSEAAEQSHGKKSSKPATNNLQLLIF